MDENKMMKFLQDLGIDVMTEGSKVVFICPKGPPDPIIQEMLTMGMSPGQYEFRHAPRVATLATLRKIISRIEGIQAARFLEIESGVMRIGIAGDAADWNGRDWSGLVSVVEKDPFVMRLEIAAEDEDGRQVFVWDRKAVQASEKAAALAAEEGAGRTAAIDAIDVGLVVRALETADSVEAFLEVI